MIEHAVIVVGISDNGRFLRPQAGDLFFMENKPDYSPVVEETGEAEKRREGRKWKAFLWGAHAFWIYALLLGGIVILLFWVL